MAVSGNLGISAIVAPCHQHPTRMSMPSSKVNFAGFTSGGCTHSETKQKWPSIVISGQEDIRGQSKLYCRISGDQNSSDSISQDIQNFMFTAINMSFFERLNLAWKIIFPSPASRKKSNARIAKQRLKMILFSDRCAVSDEAKTKIVKNVVRALSDFVEIESQEKVQLSVSTDTDLGTIYSVTVPVRRVKAEYQDMEEPGAITNIEYKDTMDGSVDVRFDFYIPDK